MFGFNERRSSPRQRPHSFATPFGEVVDVSEGGMKVTHKGPAVEPGDHLDLTISWDSELVEVRCEVKRVKPAGFRRQTVAFRWINPPENISVWLRGGNRHGGECTGPRVYARPVSA